MTGLGRGIGAVISSPWMELAKRAVAAMERQAAAAEQQAAAAGLSALAAADLAGTDVRPFGDGWPAVYYLTEEITGAVTDRYRLRQQAKQR